MYMIGSSLIEEFAFSNGRDPVLDTSKTDKFTYYSESYLEKNGETASVQDLTFSISICLEEIQA
eukprot:CAMPEP_0114583768 /NCGR_PEP_ID=MMETSP0125-20121206/7462_1 /TAXON_ID=485358 ORGANISM="Aristerostoma sp., Strain ATCC 50986" /NCGR_SAMPLE_ID=MMETSP0125 /ASSEMBLY_ACC=CAM_ASM_000245 /LENGTH=63 /DNA_ID=CAMNT_0001777477 /DNA_START=579 /DNA_END=770 /DNA_ORIENTATION=-